MFKKLARVCLCFILSAVFIQKGGWMPECIRSMLLCQIWILAGVCDVDTYEIPDFIHVLLFLAGLIRIQWLPAIAGLLLVPLPFFITAICTNGRIGGGDVKLMMVTGFAVGAGSGIRIMVWGLLLAILWGLTVQRGSERLPLAPFLGAGVFIELYSG